MRNYDYDAWTEFFLGMLGATAALTGLLFVAISINVERILETEGLAARAAEALAAFLLALVVSAVAMIPQSARATGLQVLVLAALALGGTLPRQLAAMRANPHHPTSWHSTRIAATAAGAVPAAIGGVSLAASAGGGFYWLAAASLLGVLGAAYSAWVLLIEILR